MAKKTFEGIGKIIYSNVSVKKCILRLDVGTVGNIVNLMELGEDWSWYFADWVDPPKPKLLKNTILHSAKKLLFFWWLMVVGDAIEKISPSQCLGLSPNQP